jgi:hypothetical protein
MVTAIGGTANATNKNSARTFFSFRETYKISMQLIATYIQKLCAKNELTVRPIQRIFLRSKSIWSIAMSQTCFRAIQNIGMLSAKMTINAFIYSGTAALLLNQRWLNCFYRLFFWQDHRYRFIQSKEDNKRRQHQNHSCCAVQEPLSRFVS